MVDANTFVRVVLCFPTFLSTVRANSTQLASIFVFFFLLSFPIQYILYFLPKFYFASHLPAPLTYAHNCIGLNFNTPTLFFLYWFSHTVLRIEGVFGSFFRSPFGACPDATLKPSQMRWFQWGATTRVSSGL